ncbi:unnamed protein product [Spirodela intermedia]|uniref:Uncharacterized protein n=1 Tax=Spirodela intermedia TaxID=51605 RepID=A0A7I8IIT2_SPIIN|nr:unnamed protein product [Spirodela intermedia]CAA6657789.1 unnamed protein product [Spirodela intermedia]
MEDVHRELEEVKMAMGKLTVDFRAKSELANNLRRAYEEQCAKLQEAKMQIGKQAQELCEKSEEIASASQMYEDLKLSFHEKDSVLKTLSSVHDQLRISLQGKLTTLEGENRELAIALNEANAQIKDQTWKLSTFEEEVKKLKDLLLESQKRCADAEGKAEAAKDLRRREEEKLKWRTEQFRHLEDAKEKLQEQFHMAMKEWQSEKSTLVDEICSLQKNLESKSRVADDLHSRLQMSNQALAHEESRRKLLEIQMSESKVACQNVLTDYEEAALKITELHLLKESEHKKIILEQENLELLASLKELREAQISEAGTAVSLKSMRQKLKSLEHEHRECATVLKSKEAGWLSQMEKMVNDLNECIFQISCKDKQLQAFEAELEATCCSLFQLKLEVEESNAISIVLFSKYPEIQSDIERMGDEVELYIAEKVGQIALLKEQVRSKSSALDRANVRIEEEQEARKMLLERVESLEVYEQKHFLIQKELNDYKEMLQKSSEHVHNLEALLLQKESSSREALEKISDALDAANFVRAEQEQELKSVKFELQHSKLAAEKLEKSKLDAQDQIQLYHDECEHIRRELETTLLSKMEVEKSNEQVKGDLLRIIKERDRKIDDLQQRIAQDEEDKMNKESAALVLTKLAAEETLRKEKDRFHRSMKEKENILKGTQREFDNLLRDLSKIEIEAFVTLEQTRISFILLTMEKEKEMADLLRKIASLEIKSIKSLELSEHKCFLIEKELNDCREMLEESSKHVNNLKAKLFEKESSFKEELDRISDALDAANSVCSEKEQDLKLANFELQQSKAAGERLEKSKLDAEAQIKFWHQECQNIRKELETSLLSKLAVEKANDEEKGSLLRVIEEKDRRIRNLQQRISQIEEEKAAQDWETLRKEKESLLRIIREKDKGLEALQREIDQLLQDFSRADNEALITLEQSRSIFLQLTEVKEGQIENLRKEIISLEENRSLEAAMKQSEIETLSKALEKSSEAHNLDMQELEYNKLLIRSYEDGFEVLKQKSEMQLEESSDLRRSLIAFQSELEIQKSEREREKIQAEEELSGLNKSLVAFQYELEIERSKRERERIQGEEELSGLTKSLVAFQSELETERSEREKERMQAEEELSEEILVEFQSKLEIERSERERERIQAAEELSGLKKSLVEFQSKLEIERSEREREKIQAEDELSDLKKSLVVFQSKLESERSERARERVEADDELSGLKKSLVEFQSELKIERSERERERIQAEDELSGLKKSVEVFQSELEIERSERERERMLAEGELSELKKSVEVFQSELQIERSERERERTQAEEELLGLKKSVAAFQSELESERSERARARKYAEDELQIMRSNEKKLIDEAKESKKKMKQLTKAAGKMSSEWEKAVAEAADLSDLMTQFMSMDNELRERWERIVQLAEPSRACKGEERRRRRL